MLLAARSAEEKLASVTRDFSEMGQKYNEMMGKFSDVCYENESLTRENEHLRALLEEAPSLKARARKKSGEKREERKKTARNFSICMPYENANKSLHEKRPHSKKSGLKRLEHSHQHRKLCVWKGREGPDECEHFGAAL